jgi:hypothetical protein
MFNFLKIAGTRACPVGMGYLRIAGTGMIFYPWRVADSDASVNFYSRIRIYKVISAQILPLPSLLGAAHPC